MDSEESFTDDDESVQELTDEVAQELKDDARDLVRQPLVYDTSPDWIGPPRATRSSVIEALVIFMTQLHKKMLQNIGRRRGHGARIKLLQVIDVLIRHMLQPQGRELYITVLWYIYRDLIVADYAANTNRTEILMLMKRKDFPVFVEVVLDMVGLTRRDVRIRTESQTTIASSGVTIQAPTMVFNGTGYEGIPVPDSENFGLTLRKVIHWICIVEKSCVGTQFIDVGLSDTAIPGTTGIIIIGHGHSTANGRALLNRVHQEAGRIIPVAVATDGDFGGEVIAHGWMEPTPDRDDTHVWDRDEYLRRVTRVAMEPSELSSEMGPKHRKWLPSLTDSAVKKLKEWRDKALPSLRKEVDWMIENKKSAGLTFVETAVYADAVNGGEMITVSEYIGSVLREWWDGLPEDVKDPAMDFTMDSGED